MSRSAPGAPVAARIGLAVFVAWAISPILGGQAHVSPVWFVGPIVWTAFQHRAPAALLVALVSGILAGPLTPADVASGTAQPLTLWVSRTVFFVLLAAAISHQTRRLRTAALHDPLTGLVNRAGLAPSAQGAIARSRRRGEAVGLVYVDLDDFKVVNDSLGHACGDELLRKVAERLHDVARSGDVLARHGGDEFIVLLEGLGDDRDQATVERNAASAVERIAGAFESPFVVSGREMRVACSAGLSLLPGDAQDADNLHRHADAAMYAAKTERLAWTRYAPSARDPLDRLARAGRLRDAIEGGDLELHFQPIFRVGGSIVGVEALARWRDGDAGYVPPSDFIPLAESMGLIDALGDWVVGALFQQAREWGDEGLRPHYGFNVAPRQLRQPEFADSVIAALLAHRLDATEFVIELTESAWTIEEGQSLHTLTVLRAAGFSLAIDDFGNGYSSLSRIRDLSAEVIKIDRSLLQGVPENAESVAIMMAVFGLAAAFGSDVVAEGVETEEQYAFLEQQGCRLAQGYALGRPMPAAEMAELLRANLANDRRETPSPVMSPRPQPSSTSSSSRSRRAAAGSTSERGRGSGTVASRTTRAGRAETT